MFSGIATQSLAGERGHIETQAVKNKSTSYRERWRTWLRDNTPVVDKPKRFERFESEPSVHAESACLRDDLVYALVQVQRPIDSRFVALRHQGVDLEPVSLGIKKIA